MPENLDERFRKYRSYTAAELLEWMSRNSADRRLREKDGGAVYEILGVSPETILLGDEGVIQEPLLVHSVDEYEHLDGSPCGIAE